MFWMGVFWRFGASVGMEHPLSLRGWRTLLAVESIVGAAVISAVYRSYYKLYGDPLALNVVSSAGALYCLAALALALYCHTLVRRS